MPLEPHEVPELAPFDESMIPGLKAALAVIEANMAAMLGMGVVMNGGPDFQLDYGQRCKFAGMSQAQIDIHSYLISKGESVEYLDGAIERGKEFLRKHNASG
jgi:hypothetical protein